MVYHSYHPYSGSLSLAGTSEDILKMPTDQDVEVLGQGSTEKSPGINHGSPTLEAKHTPKHVADIDPDEALKLVTAQYAFRFSVHYLACKGSLFPCLSIIVTDSQFRIVRERP